MARLPKTPRCADSVLNDPEWGAWAGLTAGGTRHGVLPWRASRLLGGCMHWVKPFEKAVAENRKDAGKDDGAAISGSVTVTRVSFTHRDFKIKLWSVETPGTALQSLIQTQNAKGFSAGATRGVQVSLCRTNIDERLFSRQRTTIARMQKSRVDPFQPANNHNPGL
jgi:hypothetical protein